MTHQARVLKNIESLSSLTDTALQKIDVNILTVSSRKMNDLLGNTAYDDYVSLQNDETVTNAIEAIGWLYEEASLQERKLKDLELAEAYCALYYTAMALKKIDIDTVMTQIETWGEGSIKPIDVMRVVEYADRYLIEAKIIVRPYSNEIEADDTIVSAGGISLISI